MTIAKITDKNLTDETEIKHRYLHKQITSDEESKQDIKNITIQPKEQSSQDEENVPLISRKQINKNKNILQRKVLLTEGQQKVIPKKNVTAVRRTTRIPKKKYLI